MSGRHSPRRGPAKHHKAFAVRTHPPNDDTRGPHSPTCEAHSGRHRREESDDREIASTRSPPLPKPFRECIRCGLRVSLPSNALPKPGSPSYCSRCQAIVDKYRLTTHPRVLASKRTPGVLDPYAHRRGGPASPGKETKAKKGKSTRSVGVQVQPSTQERDMQCSEESSAFSDNLHDYNAEAEQLEEDDGPCWGKLVATDSTCVVPVINLYGIVMLGRSPTLNVRLTSKHISQHHCVIWVDREDCYIKDTSENGTRVDGTRVPRGVAVPLNPGAKITVLPQKEGISDKEIAYMFQRPDGAVLVEGKNAARNRLPCGRCASWLPEGSTNCVECGRSLRKERVRHSERAKLKMRAAARFASAGKRNSKKRKKKPSKKKKTKTSASHPAGAGSKRTNERRHVMFTAGLSSEERARAAEHAEQTLSPEDYQLWSALWQKSCKMLETSQMSQADHASAASTTAISGGGSAATTGGGAGDEAATSAATTGGGAGDEAATSAATTGGGAGDEAATSAATTAGGGGGSTAEASAQPVVAAGGADGGVEAGGANTTAAVAAPANKYLYTAAAGPAPAAEGGDVATGGRGGAGEGATGPAGAPAPAVAVDDDDGGPPPFHAASTLATLAPKKAFDVSSTDGGEAEETTAAAAATTAAPAPATAKAFDVSSTGGADGGAGAKAFDISSTGGDKEPGVAGGAAGAGAAAAPPPTKTYEISSTGGDAPPPVREKKTFDVSSTGGDAADDGGDKVKASAKFEISSTN